MGAIGYYNGTIGLSDEMQVPMNDRAVFFGDGCYEACFAVDGRLFGEAAHFDRFYRSLQALRIPFSMPRAQLKAEIDRVLQACGERSVSLYWQVSRATAPRQHTFPDGDAKPNLLITATPKAAVFDDAPMRLITVPDIRYGLCDVKTLNLIPNILAGQQAKEAGAHEAVFVRNDTVTEGSHTNIHILRDGVLFTHPTDRHILAGVTRGIVLRLCRDFGIPISETPFSREQLRNADEILVSSSLSGIHRVSVLDGEPVGGRADTLYRAIEDAYYRTFSKEMQL